MDIAMILANDDKGWIGKAWKLPWHLPSDMEYFREITSTALSMKKKNAVIMGRKTWESIPEKYRPLPNRDNYILTHDKNYQAPVTVFHDLDDALRTLQESSEIETLFIIGGSTLYNEAIKRELPTKIYLTKIIWDFDCDTFFNGVPGNYKLEWMSEAITENNIMFQWLTYERPQPKITFKPAMLSGKAASQAQE